MIILEREREGERDREREYHVYFSQLLSFTMLNQFMVCVCWKMIGGK